MSYEWYIPSMNLIAVVPKGMGPKCGENLQKCIKNAKDMWKSMIRSQGNNII